MGIANNVDEKLITSYYNPSGEGRIIHPKQVTNELHQMINTYMDYLPRKSFLSSDMRSVLMDWLIELAEEYNLQQVTLHMAVSLVDRCLACCKFLEDENKKIETEDNVE